MHDAQRRTKEYELLTEIGQAISSRLDQDEVLRSVQQELGQIFDTSNFYIAFQEGDAIRFELEVEKGLRRRKPQCRGEAYLLRFADDFVVSFQFRKEVDDFQQKVRTGFAEFGLELAEEKTRRILFGRFAGV